MFCPNCGFQLPDDARFCSECGTVLTPGSQSAASEPAPAPVAAPAPQPAPVIQPAPSFAAPLQPEPSYDSPRTPIVYIPEQKNNILCVVGFFSSLGTILLGGIPSIVTLILSIIGLVQAKKKNERGRGLAIAGIIISSVLVASLTLGIIIGVIKNFYE
ncbi:MAG: DUF4190 domain-containing protein [Lachnospiraceae bacterium]|nr:DUF4190 domain-containing protein [Lachnospiraceae bacterium]